MSTDKMTKEDINKKNPERPSDMGYGGRNNPNAATTDHDEEE